MRVFERIAFCLFAGLAAHRALADSVISTTTYGYTGSPQTYTAPANTAYVVVKAWGAGGGEGVGTLGGGGAYVVTTVALTVAQQLTLKVGGAGQGYMTGGWPGGGTAIGLGAAGGGGCTYVTTGDGRATIWAGAGGGGGNGASFNGVGGYAGGSGAAGGGGGPGNSWGRGATQSAGGVGGTGDAGTGSAGIQGQGGNSNVNSGYVGGGGGAGYYGGGGGGSGSWGNGGGGGGGGSSIVLGSAVSNISYSPGSGNAAGGTSDSNYPGVPMGYGGNTGTYSNGYAGYVVIIAYQTPPSLPSSFPESFYTRQPISFQIPATATSFGISGQPSGLTVSSTGLVSGPALAAGSYSFTVTATNAGGTSSSTVNLTVAAPQFNGTVSFSSPSPHPGDTETISIQASSPNTGIWSIEMTVWPVTGSPSQYLWEYTAPYPSSASPNSNPAPTYTVPGDPGTYTVQLRVVDQYQNYQDFGYIFIVNPQVDTVGNGYSTSFESSPTVDAEGHSYTVGNIFPQFGWYLWQGLSNVVSNSQGLDTAQNGVNSLQLQGGTPQVYLLKSFSSPAASTEYVDVYALPVAAASAANSSILDYGDARIGFQLAGNNPTTQQPQATVMVFNGNGTGGGSWVDTGWTYPINPATNRPTSAYGWLRITAALNYSNYTWEAIINNVEIRSSYWMITTTNSSFSTLTCYGTATADAFLDSLTVTPTNPFPAPTDSLNPSATQNLIFGQSFTVTSNATDPLGGIYETVLYWVQPDDTWTLGSENIFPQGTASGSAPFTLTPVPIAGHNNNSVVGTWFIWTADYNAGGSGAAIVYINVAAATPILQAGTFTGKTVSGTASTYTLTAGDLNALFANPYNSSVVQPTPTVSYAITARSGYSPSPLGAVTVGSVLQPGTYTIVATSAADLNYTSATASATFTIISVPTAPSNLALSNVLTTSLTITWSAATGGTGGVTSYKIFRNNSSIALVQLGPTAVSYTDTSLANNTTYYYTVVAYDANGDSTASTIVSATTLQILTGIPSNVDGLLKIGSAPINDPGTSTNGDASGSTVQLDVFKPKQ